MGGTGLEPVTPSLSILSGRSPWFAVVRSGRMVERNRFDEEHLSERERTTNVAIVATSTELDLSHSGSRTARFHRPWHGLYLRPLPHGQGSFRLTVCASSAGSSTNSGSSRATAASTASRAVP